MCPRGNTERERSTTEREHPKRFVGASQSRIAIGLTKWDRKGVECAVDTPIISGLISAVRDSSYGACT